MPAGNRVRTFILIAMAVIAGGCDFPRDAGNTWTRIQHQKFLRVGAVDRPPWVLLNETEPTGIEPRLLRWWSSELGITISWSRGSESSLIEALRQREIDVLIGGFEDSSPWVAYAAPSQPFLRTSIVIAVPGTSKTALQLSEINGRIVAHSPSRPDLAAKIAELGGKPEAIEPVGRLAAVYRFTAKHFGLQPTSIELADEKHVMFVPKGESRTLLELDRFLSRAARRAADWETSP